MATLCFNLFDSYFARNFSSLDVAKNKILSTDSHLWK